MSERQNISQTTQMLVVLKLPLGASQKLGRLFRVCLFIFDTTSSKHRVAHCSGILQRLHACEHDALITLFLKASPLRNCDEKLKEIMPLLLTFLFFSIWKLISSATFKHLAHIFLLNFLEMIVSPALSKNNRFLQLFSMPSGKIHCAKWFRYTFHV